MCYFNRVWIGRWWRHVTLIWQCDKKLIKWRLGDHSFLTSVCGGLKKTVHFYFFVHILVLIHLPQCQSSHIRYIFHTDVAPTPLPIQWKSVLSCVERSRMIAPTCGISLQDVPSIPDSDIFVNTRIRRVKFESIFNFIRLRCDWKNCATHDLSVSQAYILGSSRSILIENVLFASPGCYTFSERACLYCASYYTVNAQCNSYGGL